MIKYSAAFVKLLHTNHGIIYYNIACIILHITSFWCMQMKVMLKKYAIKWQKWQDTFWQLSSLLFVRQASLLQGCVRFEMSFYCGRSSRTPKDFLVVVCGGGGGDKWNNFRFGMLAYASPMSYASIWKGSV